MKGKNRMDEDHDDKQLIQVRISPTNMIKINQAQQIIRKINGCGGVPTQSEAVDWILEGFPADQLFKETFYGPQQVRKEGENQADLQAVRQ